MRRAPWFVLGCLSLASMVGCCEPDYQLLRISHRAHGCEVYSPDGCAPQPVQQYGDTLFATVGDSVWLAGEGGYAAGCDGSGRIAGASTPGPVDWRSSDPGVVAVDAEGTARFVGPGDARVSLHAVGQVRSVNFSVHRSLATLTLQLAEPPVVGQKARVAMMASYADGSPATGALLLLELGDSTRPVGSMAFPPPGWRWRGFMTSAAVTAEIGPIEHAGTWDVVGSAHLGNRFLIDTITFRVGAP